MFYVPILCTQAALSEKKDEENVVIILFFSPPVLDKIADRELRTWAGELNSLWKTLARQVWLC